MAIQFGLTAELFDSRWSPLGTVYDPFIARGLDALIHALYVGRGSSSSRPRPASRSPRRVAPISRRSRRRWASSCRVAQVWEPAFGQEVAWCLLEAHPRRASTRRRVQHVPAADDTARRPDARRARRARLGDAEWRRQVLAGGYRLMEAAEVAARCRPDAPVVRGRGGHGRAGSGRGGPRWSSGKRSRRTWSWSRPRPAVAELAGRRLSAIRGHTDATLGHLGTLIPAATAARRSSRSSTAPRRAGLPGRRVRGAGRAPGHGPLRPVGTIPTCTPMPASTPTTSSRPRSWRSSWRHADGQDDLRQPDRGPVDVPARAAARDRGHDHEVTAGRS